jgi:putative phosphoesterase
MIKAVLGNHDHYIITNDYSKLSEDVEKVDSLNRNIIKKENLTWVKKQPETQELEIQGIKISVFHANPITPIRGYIQKVDAVQRLCEFKKLTGAHILILGHTHRPYVHSTGNFAIINPGSVGLPRDESRSSYMLLDINDGEFEVTHYRIEYDYDANADAMSVLGFPKRFVKRMRTGPRVINT